eukprot:TRINITY_DN24087_c0_g1_i1.p1 TRINITY_DN24087_c0_g1~~TRINITY_DN24087_c0_g1_i1.p1  ORF type:complete len:983 (+),score=300.11 TRINITY_DN24087_c0_g1_i1:102-3050(+)
MGCSSTKVQPAKQPGASSEATSAAATGVVPSADASQASASKAPASSAAVATKASAEEEVVGEPENEPGHPDSNQGASRPTSLNEWSRSAKKNERIRKQVGEDGDAEAKDGFNLTKPEVAMSPEARRFILKVLQKHFLFAGLEDEERTTVADYMMSKKVKANDVIFEQGQKGDCCYFIQSGVFMVTIDDAKVKQLTSKHTFGELAMLYNVNRTATVTCTQEGLIWLMSGDCFRQCMHKLSDKHERQAMNFLNLDPNFSTMNEEQKKMLAGACTVQVFGRGEQIMREGEVGDWMFIVIDGNVQTVDRFGNSAMKQQGTVLGSAGLMYTKHQISGARATDTVKCLALGKSAVERLLGPVEELLRRNAVKTLLLDNTGSELEFFKLLSVQQQDLFLDQLQETSYEAHEVIASPGSFPQLVVVVDGEVAVVTQEEVEASKRRGSVGFAAALLGSSSKSEKSEESPESAMAALQKYPPEKLRAKAKEVLSSGMTYGGQNLMSNEALKVCLVALNPVKVQRVSNSMLAEKLKQPINEIIQQNEIKKVLSDIFLFKNLTDDQIEMTVKALTQQQYKKGSPIVKQGEEAEKFYLIQSGVVSVYKDSLKLRSLGRWDYFGERGLLLQDKRSCSCIADEDCMCLVLDSKVFSNIVGIFRTELEHRMNLQDLDITMQDLRLQAVVGRGSFGVVKLVFHKDDNKRVYALKCVGKKQVLRQGQQKAMCIEREICAQCYHPCIMQFIKTFQDSKNVYFLTEFLGGGDLFYAIREIGHVSKEQSQYFGGSITLALEYLHARKILYRDLKPENVLLDFKGQAKLVDFGCCKIAVRTNTLVGTPEYFAPEAILGKGYTCAIDWWALGVVMHEFVVGPLPFGRDKDDQLELFREILEAPLHFPNYITDNTAISIINGLLERQPELRLGASARGASELKEHIYFNGFDWNGLAGRYLQPPWHANLKKLQLNWDLKKGEKAEEGNGWDPNAKIEPGMEWAKNF